MTCFSRSITPLTHIALRAMSFTIADQLLFLPLKDSSSCSKFFDKLLTDHKFGIKSYPPNSAERREIRDFFGLGLHVASRARPTAPKGRREGSAAEAIYLVPKTRSIMAVSEKDLPISLQRFWLRNQSIASSARPSEKS